MRNEPLNDAQTDQSSSISLVFEEINVQVKDEDDAQADEMDHTHTNPSLSG